MQPDGKGCVPSLSSCKTTSPQPLVWAAAHRGQQPILRTGGFFFRHVPAGPHYDLYIDFLRGDATAPETSYGVDEHGNPPSNTKAHGEHQGTLGTRCTRFFLATRFFFSNTGGTRVNPGQPGQLDPGPEPANLMVLQD